MFWSIKIKGVNGGVNRIIYTKYCSKECNLSVFLE